MNGPNIFITDATCRLQPPQGVELREFSGEVPSRAALLIGDLPQDVIREIMTRRRLIGFQRMRVQNTIIGQGDIVLTRGGQIFRAEATTG